MIVRQKPAARCTVIGVVAVGLVALTACHHAPPAVSPPPAIPAQQQLSSPPEFLSAATSPVSSPDTAAEVHVSIDTHGQEQDVRLVLAYLADQGKLSLIYSPEINKKVRLQLHDMPVSQALQAVLAASGLMLENLNGAKTSEPTSSVVFYQLPVNVDSLSVEAIMKRFGVGRTAAELIFQSRTNKP
jgi:hypothetical protein